MTRTDILTVRDVAEHLGISDQLVRMYERQGKIPAVRTARGWRLFLRADVEAFAAQRNRGGR